MNNKLLLLAFATCVGSGTAVAHDIADKKAGDDKVGMEVELNPVVVTGNGHQQLLKSTTTPVHVLSQKLIKEAGVTDFQDALTRLMPQVSFAPNAMGSYMYWFW